jgi:tetratricopeptide (TPR) repeat protein
MIANPIRCGIVLLLGTLLTGCAWTSSGVRPVIAFDGEQIVLQDPVGNGRALLLNGQYGLAVGALTQILQQEPRNVRALALLAVAYDHLKRYDLADRYHSAALQIDPNSVAALNNWGYSYLVRGDKARAVGLLERAAAVSKDRPVVAANLALANGEATSTKSAWQNEAQVAGPIQDIRLSQHVTLVRRVGQLMRLAPGVQLLVTAEQPSPARWSLTAAPATATTDTRFALFRKLFSLVEEEQAAASKEMAHSSPFVSFPGVDDFSAL